MVVDSSALIAILFMEEDSQRYADAIDAADRVFISSLNWLEAAVVAEARKGTKGAELFNELIMEIGIETLPFDRAQAEIALDAWRMFGKGRHPAGLNIGDCAAYALARTLGDTLLFKGSDFEHTDVVAVLK